MVRALAVTEALPAATLDKGVTPVSPPAVSWCHMMSWIDLTHGQVHTGLAPPLRSLPTLHSASTPQGLGEQREPELELEPPLTAPP